MKLPPGFKLSYTTNPLKIKFQYEYENGEIFEREIYRCNLSEVIRSLWVYFDIITKLKTVRLPERFTAKFDLKTEFCMLFYDNNVVTTRIDLYSLLHDFESVEATCNAYLKNKKLNSSAIIDSLNKGEEVDEEILDRIRVF